MRSHLIAPLIHALLRQRKLISQNLTFAKLYLREKYIFHLVGFISRRINNKIQRCVRDRVVNFPLINSIFDLRQFIGDVKCEK
jgi:hypothetical protein